MNAHIIDNVSYKPNCVELNGEKFDLQLNMFVMKELPDFEKITRNLQNFDNLFKLLTALMNGDLAKRGEERRLNPDYVAACIDPTNLSKYTRAIAVALGVTEKSEAESELDDAIEAEGVEDPEKN